MKIDKNSSLLFIGDSITDCGRDYPVGMKEGLGDGYVSIVNTFLSAWHSENKIKIMNTGISGNRITDLELRWQKDVLDLNPDWLSIMIGINDVWRQFDSLHDPDQVSPERFENIYRKLLETAIGKVKGIVLISPYYLEINLSDPMRTVMDNYGKIVKSIAAEYNCVFVDVQAEFDKYLTADTTRSISNDRVHPDRTGHMIIAAAFLKAVGFDWKFLSGLA